MNDKIDLEVAEAEFERFAEDMDLDLDLEQLDAEDKATILKNRKRIVKAIQLGSLIINENGEAVYTPRNGRSKYKEPITFHERTGASLMAMDGKKKNEDMGKTYAIMGNMCKIHPNNFAGLCGIDIKICEGIFALLMD